ncbi:MAG: acyl-CoA dehydrogenase family protein [Gemmatimonadetes bacterium]|nr:acyl-CoA dehydrogenase family protein [Gemmatimonadota bacterium]
MSTPVQGLAGLDAETLEMTLEAIREFSDQSLPLDRLLELDRTHEFPEETVRAMCSELGVQLLFIPEAYGGMGGGAFDVYRVCELMAGIDLAVATGVLATFLGSDPIVFGGTEEQKALWLGRIAEEGLLMAYGATEPEAGSDLGALRTTATPVEEDGEMVGYRVNGAKMWISNGGYADLYSVLAMAPGGPTWFVMEKGAEGFTPGKPEDKHGIRASNTAALSFEDVYFPVESMVGGVEGQGLVQAQLVFGYTRLMVAAFGLGAGWAAAERAIRYSTTRIQGGTPLSQKQGYTHKLIVPHACRLEAGRAYIEETATRIDAGEGTLNTEGAISKYLATEAGNGAADAAIQAHGGYGYVREYVVEKIRRDVRITTIYEGTSEIMEMTIARDRWQTHLKTRGRHYHDEAAALETLHASSATVGAGTAALAAHALAELLERARTQRLTRHQHMLFRLGELIAWVEGAGAFARRAAAALAGTLAEKSDRRISPEGLAAMSRVFAREAGAKVDAEGMRWTVGAAGVGPGETAAFAATMGHDGLVAAQAGLMDDMDKVAEALYASVEG